MWLKRSWVSFNIIYIYVQIRWKWEYKKNDGEDELVTGKRLKKIWTKIIRLIFVFEGRMFTNCGDLQLPGEGFGRGNFVHLIICHFDHQMCYLDHHLFHFDHRNYHCHEFIIQAVVFIPPTPIWTTPACKFNINININMNPFCNPTAHSWNAKTLLVQW